MKQLKELGISPAPWTYYDNCLHTAIPTFTVRTPYGVLANDVFEENARFIAAAPKLYEEQYDDCIALRTIVNKLREGVFIHNLLETLEKMADRMEAVLAEAAGEEVDDGK